MTNNKEQTTVEWLEEQTRKHEWHSLKRGEIFEQAKELEKRDKIKFATDFFFWWYNQTSGTNTYEAVEKFYKQTYGGGEQ